MTSLEVKNHDFVSALKTHLLLVAVTLDTVQIVKHQSEAKLAFLRKQPKTKKAVQTVRTDSFLTDSSFSFSATFSRLTIFATVAQSAPLEFPPWIPCRLLLFGFGSGFLKKGSINSWNKE